MGSVGGEEAIQDPTSHEERILVSVRFRPLNDKELARNDVSEWECINDTTIIYRNNLPASERSLYPTAYSFGMNTLHYTSPIIFCFNLLPIMQHWIVYIHKLGIYQMYLFIFLLSYYNSAWEKIFLLCVKNLVILTHKVEDCPLVLFNQ